jgi:hypothetical protein
LEELGFVFVIIKVKSKLNLAMKAPQKKTYLKFEISGIPFVWQSHPPTHCRFPGSIKFKNETLMIMVYGLSANVFKAWHQTVCFNVGPRTHNINLDSRSMTMFSPPVVGLISRALVVQRKSIRANDVLFDREKENISFQDLPIGDDDPDPNP